MLESEKIYLSDRLLPGNWSRLLFGKSRKQEHWQQSWHIHESCEISKFAEVITNGGVYVGPRTRIAASSHIVSSGNAFSFTRDKVAFGDVIIGSDVTIEKHTAIYPGSVIPDGSVVNRSNSYKFTDNEDAWDQIDLSFANAKKPLFVLSTGRSGSVSISDALSKNPAYKSKHESIKALTMAGYLKEHHHQTFLRHRSSFMNRMQFAGQIASPGIWAESDQRLFNMIDELLECYPDSMFIHLVRDFEPWESSAREKLWYECNAKNHLWERFRPHPVDDPNWINVGGFEKRKWYYDFVNDRIRRDLKKLVASNDRMEVNLDGEERDSTIQAFLGHPIQLSRKNVGKKP